MPLSDARKSAAIDAAIPGTTVYVGLHTANPPTTVNEVTGGGYARQAVTVPVSGGATTRSATGGPPVCTFDVPTATIASIGIWDGDVEGAGTLLAWFDSADVATTSGDKVDVNSLTFSTSDVAGQ